MRNISLSTTCVIIEHVKKSSSEPRFSFMNSEQALFLLIKCFSISRYSYISILFFKIILNVLFILYFFPFIEISIDVTPLLCL